jgi:hypothetical protein
LLKLAGPAGGGAGKPIAHRQISSSPMHAQGSANTNCGKLSRNLLTDKFMYGRNCYRDFTQKTILVVGRDCQSTNSLNYISTRMANRYLRHPYVFYALGFSDFLNWYRRNKGVPLLLYSSLSCVGKGSEASPLYMRTFTSRINRSRIPP